MAGSVYGTGMLTRGTRPAALRYGLSVIAVALVVVVRMALAPAWSLAHPSLLFYPAIILAGWFGGFGPGALATGLAVFALTYLWFPPLYSLRIGSQSDVVALLLFVAVNFVISLLNEALFRAQRRASQLSSELQRLKGRSGDP
jgi:K+-sensing histidine kinase KdpD